MSKLTAFVVCVLVLGATGVLDAQSGGLVGEWRGTKSERNAITGQTFTIDFAFEFRNDGTYREVARLGRLTILSVDGRYSVRAGRKPGDPSFNRILILAPNRAQVEPDRDELRLLQMAGIPSLEQSEQYMAYYNLAPAGGLTLQDTGGGETWGLQRLP